LAGVALVQFGGGPEKYPSRYMVQYIVSRESPVTLVIIISVVTIITRKMV